MALEAGVSEHEQAAQLVLVHLTYRIQDVAVDRHGGRQATSRATNRGRSAALRSVTAHPTGDVSRAAWFSHSG